MMQLKPIVNYLTDTDLYKFTMDQLFLHKYPWVSGEYYFVCRNEGVAFTPAMKVEIDEQIKEEDSQEVSDKGKLTKLMFEQLLRGMYINQFQ
jgi:nicotinic acid phosphoribosyltransferase